MLADKLGGLVDKHLVPRDHDHTLGLAGASKMDSVVATLAGRLGNGNGKLVFCHFRQEMDELISMLSKYNVNGMATFDGRNSLSARAKILESSLEVLIIQIKTGCDGLNLQAGFSEVYFVSPTWNPAVEEQAIARCHRIGQQKSVFVFRFYMDSYGEETDVSLDQYVSLVQHNKREIIQELFAI